MDAEYDNRSMYYGNDESWNFRDSHMVDTLERLLKSKGNEARQLCGRIIHMLAMRDIRIRG
jgi:erythromycin esterase-like protein